MYRTTNALLLAALLSAACSNQNPTPNPVTDDGGTTNGRDLATAPPVLGMVMTTTIRDLNSGNIPAGTHVHVTGVMQSPVPGAYAVLYDQACMFESFVVQADPTPTLQDGIAVRIIKRGLATGDMMIHDADCQLLNVNKIPRGNSVVIEGTLLVENGIHSIDLGTLGSLTSMGTAQTLPQPVVVTAAMLPSAPFGSPLVTQFGGAYGALVTLQSVTSSEMHAATVTFKVSPAATDASKTRVSTEYLQLLNAGFMLPADGTLYRSVTGVVSTDLGGTILPRGTDDLVPGP